MSDVLIVDDQSNIRRLLSITLGREFQVLEAENGASALCMVKMHHPRLVLLDVMMPGVMDGLDTLDAIKRDPTLAHIPVAIVSARGQAADLEDASRRGAAAYFVKPFSPLQVVTWVREQLG